MAKRQVILTENEIGALRRAEQQTANARELKHLQGVRLYGTGKPVAEIIDLLNCGKSTLMDWVSRYQKSGIVGLRNQWRGENANKLTVQQRHDLKRRLQTQGPAQVLPQAQRTSDGPFWTIDDLRLGLMVWYEVSYDNVSSLHRLMKRCGLSYHKVEAVYKSRPSERDIVQFEAELEKK